MTEQGLMTTSELLGYWQGHRELTRRTIEAFSEADFNEYRAPGMRTFRELAHELAHMVEYQLDWLRQGQPQLEGSGRTESLPSRAELLVWWDQQTRQLGEVIPAVNREVWLNKVSTPYGQMSALMSVQYLIDNEIHHRGQGYVYLRELGVTPPAFYDRSDLPEIG